MRGGRAREGKKVNDIQKITRQSLLSGFTTWGNKQKNLKGGGRREPEG